MASSSSSSSSSIEVTADSLRELSDAKPKKDLNTLVDAVLKQATLAAELGERESIVISYDYMFSPKIYGKVTANAADFFKSEKDGPDTFTTSYLWDSRKSHLVWKDAVAQQQFEEEMTKRGLTVELQQDRLLVKW